MMPRSVSLAALVLALVLVATASLIDVQRQNTARRQLATEATQLARVRADAFGETLVKLTSHAELFSSADAFAAYAKAKQRDALSDPITANAKRLLKEIEQVSPSMRGRARIVDAADRTSLLAGATRVRPAPSGSFSREKLIKQAQQSILLHEAQASRGELVLIVTAPIRIADAKTGLTLLLTVPMDEVLSQGLTARRRPHTELLAGNDGAVMAAAFHKTASDTNPEHHAVTRYFIANEGDPRTTELHGHMWGFYRLPQEFGEGGFIWRFLAVRAQTTPPSFMRELGRDGLAMLLASLILVVAALAALHKRRRDLEHTAGTDQLTGIPNRRSLLADLEHAERSGASVRLAMFDLNGFKEYNDSFGHLAGDALLQRVAVALKAAVAPAGAYRLGGDEFCVVSPIEQADELEALAAEALTERGPGFVVNASWGSVVFPSEASSISEALAIADERMYRDKRGGRAGALAQSKATLKTLMAERDPALAAHHQRVAELAEKTALRMGLPAEIVPHLRNAAELHDVGLLAIPDTILNKADPLDQAEQEFVSRHAVIGERILNSAESLQTAAAIVRATHERWDGAGYPAQMEGDAIPLAARIIFACDAYDVMTHDQPYRKAMTDQAARQELRKGAGEQFDADVVVALEKTLDERAADAPSKTFAVTT